MPVFDSSYMDLSFGSFFMENAFTGHDRVSEANQVSLILTSRYLDRKSGQELFSASIGQRYYFSDQEVALNRYTIDDWYKYRNGTRSIEGINKESRSDYLGNITAHLTKNIVASTTAQYSTSEDRFTRINAGIRWQPKPSAVVGLYYRYDDLPTTLEEDRIKQIDLGVQWPLTNSLYGLARYNYALDESKPVEMLAGVEYVADCWALRLVGQRSLDSEDRYDTTFFIQLELTGLGSIGSDPIEELRRAIPGYRLRQTNPVQPDFMTTMNKMKYLALLAAFSASVCMAQTAGTKTAASEPQVLNAVVAVVNNDVITTGELAERAHSAALNLRRQKIQLPPMPQLRAQVLEQLILERAISQRARETGIRVDDGVVNATIEQIAAQNKITVAELRRRLSLDGVTFPQFREEIRSQIVAQRLREREVDEEIKIPESEIDAFLADQAGYNINDTIEYNISHIWIPTSDSMSTEELNNARDTAEDILDRARDGEDFGQLAASFSRAPDALDGGNLGWRTLSQMPTALSTAVREARQNSSKIAMNVSSDGYYIVKVNDRRDGVQTKLAGGPGYPDTRSPHPDGRDPGDR